MTLSNLSSASLYKAQAGLSGMGNWAQVTATTGSPTTGTYTDSAGTSWKYYKWTTDGSVTVTTGLVDVYMISGGGSHPADVSYGNQGRAGVDLLGVQQFSAGTLTVVVGAGGVHGGSQESGASSIGSLTTGASGYGPAISTAVNGRTTSITGSSVTYGLTSASPRANSGDGVGQNHVNGAAGVVIIRVPSIFALA